MYEFPLDEAAGLLGAEPPRLEPLGETTYYPSYGEDSILAVPRGVVEYLLEGGGWLADAARGRGKVVMVLVDALGLSTLWLHRSRAGRLLSAREAWVLSSVAPTSTATVLASVVTGLAPAAHGVSGYRIYLKEIGSLVKTFEMRHPGGEGGGPIALPEGFQLIRGETVFERLAAAGVEAVSLVNKHYSESTYTKELVRGSSVVEHSQLSDLVANTVAAVRGMERGLAYVYWGGVDSASHDYGFDSPQVGEAVGLADWMVGRLVDELSGEALILVFADHGHITRGSVHVVGSCSGCLAPPYGERRFLYLLSRGDCVLEVENAVKVDRGSYARLFGGEPGGDVAERFGDCVYVMERDEVALYPYKGETVEDVMKGFHGGLTLGELLVPLLAF